MLEWGLPPDGARYFAGKTSRTELKYQNSQSKQDIRDHQNQIWAIPTPESVSNSEPIIGLIS